MEKEYITMHGWRKQAAHWRSLSLGTEDFLVAEQKLEDIFFDFGHKINLGTRTRQPVIDALKTVADTLPPSDPPRTLDRDAIAKTLFYIFQLCAPVWKRGYRMNGHSLEAERMKRLEESLRTTRRSRTPERATQSVKRALSPQPRFEPRKRACVPAAVVDSPGPRRIWIPSVTIIKGSAPEERRVIQLGSVDRSVGRSVHSRRTRAQTRSLANQWIDLSSIYLDGLLDELNQSGWLKADQEIWWSSESAEGLDVTSVQSQVKIASLEEFGEAVWDSLTSRFPAFCVVGSARDPGAPDGPTPSFTIVIRDKEIEIKREEIKEEMVSEDEGMKVLTLPLRCH